MQCITASVSLWQKICTWISETWQFSQLISDGQNGVWQEEKIVGGSELSKGFVGTLHHTAQCFFSKCEIFKNKIWKKVHFCHKVAVYYKFFSSSPLRIRFRILHLQTQKELVIHVDKAINWDTNLPFWAQFWSVCTNREKKRRDHPTLLEGATMLLHAAMQ